MGFLALLTREDFYCILKETLQTYYRNKYGSDVYIGYEKCSGAKEMFMNPRLGVIFSSSPTKQVREYIYKSFNIRNNIFKNFAARAFVFLSIHIPSIFSLPKRLYVCPANIVDDSVIFSYLNRSIRIFDFKRNRTISIKKNTFTSKYFENQIQFRQNNNFEFIPPILACCEDWFEEPILEGRCLSRETDNKIYYREIETVFKQMTRLQQSTCVYIDAEEYVDTIINQVTLHLKNANLIKHIYTYTSALKYFNTLTSYLNVHGHKLPIAESHGDLQAGNVWLSPNKTWIIDWETHAMRTIWFDYITIKFGTRYYGGIKDLVNNINEDTRLQLIGEFSTTLDIRQMIIIFLLEDLLFYLEDMMELPFDGGRDSFDAYINDIISTNITMKLRHE